MTEAVIETSPLICSSNQWTGFYMITASVMKELNSGKVFVGVPLITSKYSLLYQQKLSQLPMSDKLLVRLLLKILKLWEASYSFIKFSTSEWDQSQRGTSKRRIQDYEAAVIASFWANSHQLLADFFLR